MKENKKLIIFDIDGTIRDNKNNLIWPSTIKTIKELKEKGHTLVIASGRGYSMLKGIDEIREYIDHYIMLNGQQIMSHEKEIYKDTYSIKDIEELIEKLEKADIPYAYVTNTGYILNKIDDDVRKAYDRFRLERYIVDKEIYKREDVYEMWCFGPDEKIYNFAKTLDKYVILTWGCEGFDILKKDHTKASTIKILANKLNFDTKDIIAIGDGVNDTDMIREAGIGICMGNGNPITKSVADIVTDDIDKDGLYKAFKKLELVD